MPIGYADGVRRALTNNCDVLIGGRRYPLVGTVSMDNITVDLGPVRPASRPGQPVTIIGQRRRRAPDAPRSWPGGSGRSTTRSSVASRRACPGPITAMESRSRDRSAPDLGGDRARRMAGRRRRARPAARASRRSISTWCWRRSPATGAPRRWRAPTGGHPFELSEGFGALARGRAGPQLAGRLMPLSWATAIEADLGQRDFTINAIAEPLRGGG